MVVGASYYLPPWCCTLICHDQSACTNDRKVDIWQHCLLLWLVAGNLGAVLQLVRGPLGHMSYQSHTGL